MRSNLHSELQRRRHHQAVHEMMLGDRHRVISEPVSKHRLRKHVLIDAVAAIRLVGKIRR